MKEEILKKIEKFYIKTYGVWLTKKEISFLSSSLDEVEREAVYKFTRWWAEEQTKDKEDYIQRAAISEAGKQARRFLSLLFPSSEKLPKEEGE